MRCFSYNSGNPGTAEAKYLLHVFDFNLSAGKSTSDIKSVYYNGTNDGVGDVVGTLQSSQNKQQLYSFGYDGLLNLTDAAVNGNRNTLYDYRTKKSGSTNAASGDVTIVITGANEILPYGISAALSDTEALNFTVTVTANTDAPSNISGTLSVNTSSNTIVGSGTQFKDQLGLGDQIKVTNGSVTDIRTVSTITNSTAISVDAPFSFTNTAATAKKTYLQGKILPISTSGTGPVSTVEVTNSNTFTVHTGVITSTSMPVDVTFNVRKINAAPSKKEIKKNRFVRIVTANNPGGPNRTKERRVGKERRGRGWADN